MMIGLMELMNYNNKKEIFSELRDFIYLNANTYIKEVKISCLKNIYIIEEIRNLKVIELDNLEDFIQYTNYDHFLIFKFQDDYYFCDTQFAPLLNTRSMIKISDFNQHLRKDKIKKIDENSTY